MLFQHLASRASRCDAWFIPCFLGRLNFADTNARKCNTRNLRSHVYVQQIVPVFDQSKRCKKPTFTSGSNIDKSHDPSLIQAPEEWQAQDYSDKFIRKTTSNRRKKDQAVIESYGNIHQFFLDSCKMSKTSNCETKSMTYLPVHLYAYEKNNLNDSLDNVKSTEDRIVEPKVVLFKRTSIEKNEVFTFRSSNHLPTTERPLVLMSNYCKRKQYLRYCIRDYNRGSEVFTPTTRQVEEEMQAKKPQCLPPLGPPPIMQPKPPRRPPLPSCPRKKEKKKKFAALDKRYLLIKRQKTRRRLPPTEDHNLTT